MNLLQMNSLLNLNSSMSSMKSIHSADVAAQGQKSVLEFEIAQDKKTGCDTSMKEAQVEKIDENRAAMSEFMADIMEDVNEEAKTLTEAGDKTVEEPKEKEETEEKAKIYTVNNEEDDGFTLELNGAPVKVKNNADNKPDTSAKVKGKDKPAKVDVSV